jgi:hypothetical protein
MLKGVNDAVGLSVDCKKITMRTKKKGRRNSYLFHIMKNHPIKISY